MPVQLANWRSELWYSHWPWRWFARLFGGRGGIGTCAAESRFRIVVTLVIHQPDGATFTRPLGYSTTLSAAMMFSFWPGRGVV